jgi:hypothetical protein
MIPYSVTVASAAAPDASLRFLFYGGILILPAVAAYTIGVYWVFRGKSGDEYAGTSPTGAASGASASHRIIVAGDGAAGQQQMERRSSAH